MESNSYGYEAELKMKNKKLLIAGGGVIIALILILGCFTLVYWQISSFFSSLPAGIAGQFGVSGLDLPDDTLTLSEVLNDTGKVNSQVLIVISTNPEFEVAKKTVDLITQLKEAWPNIVYLIELQKAGEIVDCTKEQEDDSNSLICGGEIGRLSTNKIAVISGFSTPDHFESVLRFNLRWVQTGQTIALECGPAEGFYVNEQTNKAKCKEWNQEVREYEQSERDEYNSLIATLNRLTAEGNLVVVYLSSQIHKAQIEMLLKDQNASNTLHYLILDAR